MNKPGAEAFADVTMPNALGGALEAVNLSEAALAELSLLETSTPQTEGTEASRLIKDLEHSIHHLQRSNTELEEHMKEHGFDKELRVAIGENVVIIARRQAILEDLRKQAGMAPEPSKDVTMTPATVDVNDGGIYL